MCTTVIKKAIPQRFPQILRPFWMTRMAMTVQMDSTPKGLLTSILKSINQSYWGLNKAARYLESSFFFTVVTKFNFPFITVFKTKWVLKLTSRFNTYHIPSSTSINIKLILSKIVSLPQSMVVFCMFLHIDLTNSSQEQSQQVVIQYL